MEILSLISGCYICLMLPIVICLHSLCTSCPLPDITAFVLLFPPKHICLILEVSLLICFFVIVLQINKNSADDPEFS